MNNYLKLIAILCFTITCNAQVELITRNKESYTKDVFDYKGVRVLFIDEVNLENEKNVFIFSKVEKNANPDVMYLQRFQKSNNKWTTKTVFEIKHKGIISGWASRKAFVDYDKDKSVDAFFIFALYDADFKQETVNLVFSKKDKFYTIESKVSDGFSTNQFSENFKDLDENTKSNIMEYWNGLDKEDNN